MSLKVVCIVDKVGTALDRLGHSTERYNDNLNYQVIDCHPKRPSREQLEKIEKECRDADVIDAQYYRTIEKLREIFPWLKEKKTILTHNNPYSIEDGTWNDYDIVVANNNYIFERLSKITDSHLEHIPITLDTDFWKYNVDWKADSSQIMSVIMVANRIESSKGILPVAKACKKLGMSLQLVGAVSNGDYFNEIIDTGAVTFHEQISDEELRNLYYKSSVHICNSKDGFESGPMPAVEAMLCGVPVITRLVGHMPEINNGENMVVNEKDPDDVENLVELIHNLVSDKKKMEEMRDKAWNSVKVRSNERRAFMYQKLYREVLFPNQAPVTVVLPIFDKPEVIRKALDAVGNQTHQNIELIVTDDSLGTENKEIVQEFSRYVNIPVRYLKTVQYVADPSNPKGYKDYGLARARNLATIEATSDIIVYADQRQVLEPNCVENFVSKMKPNYWLYGNKGIKKEFVENLSAVYRQDVLRIGGFNERINKYGGQSEEIRKRMRLSGITTEFVENAKATPTGKSSNRNRKRQEIIAMKNKIWKMFG